MRRWFLCGALALGVIFAGNASAQAEPSLDQFYGNKSLGGGNFRYDYFPGVAGRAESGNLYYLTKSKRSADADTWPLYYGVSLEFTSAHGHDYDFPTKGEADFYAWWGLLWVQGRVYEQDIRRARPYFDFGGGLGSGEIATMGPEDDESNLNWSALTVVRFKAGTGVELMLSKGFALDLGVAVNETLGATANIPRRANLNLVSGEFKIGVSRWQERSP